MRRQITYAFVALLFLSFRIHGMDAPVHTIPMTNFPQELLIAIFHKADSLFKTAAIFEQVCLGWHRILNDDEFWQSIYRKRFGHENKVSDQPYKEHLYGTFLFSHAGEEFSLMDKAKYVYCQEMLSPNSLSQSVKNTLWQKALRQSPKVFCACHGPVYHGQQTLDPEISAFFDEALKLDVFVILPTGFSGQSIPCTVNDRDLHEIYPNVIWVTPCDDEGSLLSSSEHGPLIDIGVAISDSKLQATQIVALTVVDLRTIRPDLDAPAIRNLLLSTGRKTNNIRGGWLDRDAAIAATTDYEK